MKARVRFMDEAPASIQLHDKLQMPTKRKFKISGQMIAPCSIARVGIMEYRAKECGAIFADRDPDSIVKIMTTEQELFDAASLDSYRSAPITVGHPEEDVTTENAKELVKGVLEGMPVRDGDLLVGTLVLNDADAISLVRTNTNQLSSGHTCVLKLADEGQEWDAEKTQIRANHIAIVSRGRAGVAEIADEAPDEIIEETEVPVEAEVKVEVEAEVPKEEPVKKESLDDPASANISVGDAALVKTIEELTARLEDAESKLKEAVKKVTPEALDAAVEKRMDFIKEAETLATVDTKGKTEMEIKRAIVEKVKAMCLKDKSDEYVEVRYQILLEDRDKDDAVTDMTQVLRDTAGKVLEKHNTVPANINAREQMIKRYEGVK